jgi:hypothetical protein
MQQRKEELPVALELPVAKFQVAEWGDTAARICPVDCRCGYYAAA